MPLLESHSAWTAVAYLSIAASSVYYTWVWRRPQHFKALVHPKDPSEVMAGWANIIKLVQFASVFMCTDWRTAFDTLPLWQWLLSFALLGLGQSLNLAVYARLGVHGVYYGQNFGKVLPWVTGFPYNVCNDPQYVGCLITIAGCAFVAPLELCLWFAANYLYLMWHESELPPEAKANVDWSALHAKEEAARLAAKTKAA